ncbi:MAG TPA: PLP-dependent aminotransferase family protein [Anaeromyxobacteraceae bacterium]|nr:PLP-dependent aminotransferase family protein [Anaeromyxobacteraceae bacterium]
MTKVAELAADLRSMILAGRYRPGDPLPSVRALASERRLSVITVRSALYLLEREGLVRISPRSATRVRSRRLREPPTLCAATEAVAPTDPRLHLAEQYRQLASRGPGLAVALPGADLRPTGAVRRALARWRPHLVEPGSDLGLEALRSALVRRYWSVNGPTEPEHLLVTSGTTESLFLLFSAFLKPGDAVAVESPTYFDYFAPLAAAGAVVVSVPCQPRTGLDVGALERAAEARRVAMVICQPNVHNPLGTILPDDEKRRLVELSRRAGFLLVQDDTFGDLAYAQRRPANLSTWGDAPGVFVLGSASKWLDPGLRVGWLRSPLHVERLGAIKRRASGPTGLHAQAAVAEVLESPSLSRKLASLRNGLQARVAEHIELLSRTLPEGCSLVRPAGGCLLWLQLPEGTDASQLFRLAVAQGTVVAPGEIFSTDPAARGCVRINAGNPLTPERRAALKGLAELARVTGAGSARPLASARRGLATRQ